MIVTVTLNAAVDRTLTVPNFQLGQRHRASHSLTGAGGKGINVARALKRLDSPVVATGLAGGRTGDRIIEELAGEGILNDFVRIGDESRTSIAVVDPTAGSLTEIYEWGPAVRPDELETLLDKLHYLSRVASWVVFSGSLPRDVANGFYGEAIRDLNRRGVQCVVDCEGEPLRLGVEAEPFLVSPNQREAESLVGQEFSDQEDFVMALDAIADLGARNVLITQETSCFGLFREERVVRRFRASVERIDPVASVGAGDVLLAGFLAERFEGRPLDEALRAAVGCAAASVLELGAGRFDPREASRLAGGVDIHELPVGEPAVPPTGPPPSAGSGGAVWRCGASAVAPPRAGATSTKNGSGRIACRGPNRYEARTGRTSGRSCPQGTTGRDDTAVPSGSAVG